MLLLRTPIFCAINIYVAKMVDRTTEQQIQRITKTCERYVR
nr:MAG TPA_asm: hypothetical protein [Bacteriophage sp.]